MRKQIDFSPSYHLQQCKKEADEAYIDLILFIELCRQ